MLQYMQYNNLCSIVHVGVVYLILQHCIAWYILYQQWNFPAFFWSLSNLYNSKDLLHC